MKAQTDAVVSRSARFNTLYTAAVYDILDEMSLPNQCVDLGIRPLSLSMRVAGPAFTLGGGPDMRSDEEFEDDPEIKTFSFFERMYPGCVITIAPGDQSNAGHWGELMSNAARQRGAVGAVVDGGTRDAALIEDIPSWSVFARYSSPIEAKHRFRLRAVERPIVMTGSLSRQVRVNPGDWIFGDRDGVLVIPQPIVDEVLDRAEAVREQENATREAVRNGTPLRVVLAQFGRL